MNVFSVILAGGSGTRFWPLSRKSSPKQVLNLSGKDTLIGDAVSRFEKITERNNINILTSADSAALVKSALTNSHDINFIIEPVPRGTSACVLLAALKLQKKYGDCLMCISPSDHYITDLPAFEQSVKQALLCAEANDSIVTIGIKPTFPSTAYGYIGCNYSNLICGAYEVSEFLEKPDYDKAKQYIASGNFLWNSGIFVFKSSTIINSFKQFLPRIFTKLYSCYDVLNNENESEFLPNVYQSLQKISIDFGIIERANNVQVIPTDMGWNDIGSWDSLGCLFPIDENGNIVKAENAVLLDTKRSVIYSDNSLVTTIGVEDLIIVSSGNALLICPKTQDQRVRDIVDTLKEKGFDQYL